MNGSKHWIFKSLSLIDFCALGRVNVTKFNLKVKGFPVLGLNTLFGLAIATNRFNALASLFFACGAKVPEYACLFMFARFPRLSYPSLCNKDGLSM